MTFKKIFNVPFHLLQPSCNVDLIIIIKKMFHQEPLSIFLFYYVYSIKKNTGFKIKLDIPMWD